MYLNRFFITLIPCWIFSTSIDSCAESDVDDLDDVKKNYAYINCVSPRSTIGMRDGLLSRRGIEFEVAVGTKFEGQKALYVRGDRKSIVRIGFIDMNGRRIPNKFVQAGPNSTDTYYEFPCPLKSICIQRVLDRQISYIRASKKTIFSGCR
jgi:hypothetical protein